MNSMVDLKVKTFFSKYRQKRYKKGEVLIRSDEDPVGIYLLEEGEIRQYADSKSGTEVTLNVYKPNSFFPLYWAINNTHTMYSFEAMTPVTVRIAPKEAVVEFLKTEPQVMYDLLSRLYRGIDGLLLKLGQLMAGTAYTRLVTILCISARRFGKETPDGLTLSLTESEIASQTGITRETVSREIQSLKQSGLISHGRSTIIVRDLTRLEQELAL